MSASDGESWEEVTASSDPDSLSSDSWATAPKPQNNLSTLQAPKGQSAPSDDLPKKMPMKVERYRFIRVPIADTWVPPLQRNQHVDTESGISLPTSSPWHPPPPPPMSDTLELLHMPPPAPPVVQITGNPVASHPDPPPGNQALRDYQMQLMLLEQQNKRRLLMAKQQQPGSALRAATGSHVNHQRSKPTEQATSPGVDSCSQDTVIQCDFGDPSEPLTTVEDYVAPLPAHYMTNTREWHPMIRFKGRGEKASPEDEDFLTRQLGNKISGQGPATKPADDDPSSIEIPAPAEFQDSHDGDEFQIANDPPLLKQEYRLQLEILEEQTKRRLALAAQQQEEKDRLSAQSTSQQQSPLTTADSDDMGHIFNAASAFDDASKVDVHFSVPKKVGSEEHPIEDDTNANTSQRYKWQLWSQEDDKTRLLLEREDLNTPRNLPNKPASAPRKVVNEVQFVRDDTNTLARQDYQLQLMLLEQQNKKRLLMEKGKEHATRESDLPDQAASTPTEVVSEGATIQNDTKSLAQQNYEMQLMLLEQQNKERLRMARDVERAARNSSLPDRAPTSTIARVAEGMPPGIDLLYHVVCGHRDHHDKFGRTFRDTPVLEPAEPEDEYGCRPLNRHYIGKVPIPSLEAYLDEAFDGICAVVIRTLHCQDAPDPNALRCGRDPAFGNIGMDDDYGRSDSFESAYPTAKNPPEWQESFHLKGSSIKCAITTIAKCYFEPQERRCPRVASEIDDRDLVLLHRTKLFPADLFLFHHREELRVQLLIEPGHEVKRQIQALLDYIEVRYGQEFAEADALFARGLVDRKHALKLFQPNELVMRKVSGQATFYALQEWPKSAKSEMLLPTGPMPRGSISLTGWSFQSDGKAYGRTSTVLICKGIKERPVSITELSVYPTRFVTQEQWDLAQSRGRRAWNLGTYAQIMYTGWNAERDRYFSNAEFMLDSTCEQSKHHSRATESVSFRSTPYPFDTLPTRLDSKGDITDQCCLLIDHKFPAYSLRENKWFTLLVDGVCPVEQSWKAWDQLILPNPAKDIMQTLVSICTNGMEGEVIGGQGEPFGRKGKALLMLLHGATGTGKSFAAKSIAAAAGVPLHRIPYMDNAFPNTTRIMDHEFNPSAIQLSDIERTVKNAMKLGQKWKSIFLLEDADFSLGQRCAEGAAPASHLVQQLQAYNGVVILTATNLDAFDDAFLSRMQAVVHFDAFDHSIREQIWTNAIDKLKESGIEGEWDEIDFELSAVANLELNGHQIHNVLATAQQLARYREEHFAWTHIEESFSVSLDLLDRTVPFHCSGKKYKSKKPKAGYGWPA